MLGDGPVAATRQAAERVARHSYGKLVAFLSARLRDVAAAEDALADAFAAALESWPQAGVPASPEAWLLTVARRRMIDARRRVATEHRALEWLGEWAELHLKDGGSDVPWPDERLGLMFACAHPALDAGVRAPLILQVILGLDAASIASAFLVAPATMSQRLVRAKNKLKLAGIPFEVPERAQMPERLGAVLDAIYATYSEGWSDPLGTHAQRRQFADDGIWLGRLLVSLMPGEAEALGLLSLMLHAQARRQARRDNRGAFVPLAEQDPALWDSALIDEAERTLLEASALHNVGRFQLEAAVQSAHAARREQGATDWPAIVQLYDRLLVMTHSPVVAINRAVAIAQVEGPLAGRRALEPWTADERLANYQPYWAARAELSARTGDFAAARAELTRALGLERDGAVRAHLQLRLAALGCACGG